jgi:hypothetical protein
MEPHFFSAGRGQELRVGEAGSGGRSMEVPQANVLMVGVWQMTIHCCVEKFR